VLAGGAALALLSACGGDDGGGGDGRAGSDDDGAGDGPATSAGGTAASTLLPLLPQQGVLTTDGEQRFPLALAGADGVPIREGLPPRQFQLRADEGEPLVIDVEPRSDGVPTAYYPVTFTADGPGIHELSVVGEEGIAPVTFEVAEATAIPSVGQPLPAFDTPTTDDARGVTPICTREPACPLHDVTLRQAVGNGPLAFLIATPEFCQVAICGPVLDLLIEALEDHPSVTGLHAEVYADPRGSDDPTAGGLAPVTDAYSLPFEPTLFVADATGTITARLDSVYDRTELNEALAEPMGARRVGRGSVRGCLRHPFTRGPIRLARSGHKTSAAGRPLDQARS